MGSLRIAVLTSQAFSIINFRGSLIAEMVADGHEVIALAPDYTDEMRKKVRAIGASPMDITLSRAGRNPLKDMADLFRLVFHLRSIKPDILLVYFAKPVIYGSIAARLAGVSRRFAFIEGLGIAFGPENREMSALSRVLLLMYRCALTGASRVFFLNDQDAEVFLRGKVVSREQYDRIDGIGVDLSLFTPAPPVQNPVTFMVAARMLKQKGILDFIEAARMLRARHANVRFLLVGSSDLNPDSIDIQTMKSWADEGLVVWPGHTDNIRVWLQQASVFVLPSYYREGLPRSIQEAMAMARPIITTDWVGCRETVEEGVNGFLVPIKDPRALASAMERFIVEPELIARMGVESRRIAERRFDVRRINAHILEKMALRGTGATSGSKGRLLFLVTEDWYFVSHRLALAIEAMRQGYDVTVATNIGEKGDLITAAGIKLIPLAVTRGSMNPIRELRTLCKIIAIFRKVRPTLAHNVAIKPVLYGSIAARLSGCRKVVSTFPGMGWLFTSEEHMAVWLRTIVRVWIQRLSLYSLLLVQNVDDEALLRRLGVSPRRIRRIAGAGVDMKRYRFTPEPLGVPRVLLAARLLWEKGVSEFVEAARICRARGVRAQFIIAGEPDDQNRSTVLKSDIDGWIAGGIIEYAGWVEDMPRFLESINIACLPSYYGEGIPKSLIEAAAAGRAIVTTNMPGCREIVLDRVNGILVSPRDALSLANAIVELVENTELRQRYGAAGRSRAEELFAQDLVIEKTLAIYEEQM